MLENQAGSPLHIQTSPTEGRSGPAAPVVVSGRTLHRAAGMTTELAVVLALLAAAVTLFAINKPRMDAVALIVLTVLPFTGAVTVSEALAGFSDPNIVLIAALFVVGDGLVRTGV